MKEKRKENDGTKGKQVMPGNARRGEEMPIKGGKKSINYILFS